MRWLKLMVSGWIVVPFFLTYFGLALVPASYWHNAGAIFVPDEQHDQPIELRWQGGAQRQFLGSYTVIARSLDTNRIACDARGGPFIYHLGTTIPDPLTLDWWAPSDSRCSDLPVGAYTLETCWTVITPFWGIVPNKTQCVTSNPFRIE